ncbi:MAG: cytochrome c peroxidase [Bacteroidota bacterium]|nr:cytochrome c peroxidase [Bacteroidota bacterium]
MIKKFVLYLGMFVFTVSCKVDPKINAPLPTDNLVEVIPEGWPQPIYNFNTNPISEAKFNLGRELFYDPILSKDNTISCGSCHQQYVAFAHADHNVSHGINGLLGTRNAPALFNLNWHPAFMHDGGVNHIEVQPLAPITNTVEMGDYIEPIIAKLQASEKYKRLFNATYGSEEINTPKTLVAMAQFMALMYSYNSKYDLFKRGENNVQLTDAELRGYSLFVSKCNSCHKEPLFTDFVYRSNGMPINPFFNDSGRAHITGAAQDKYKFKTPSLRNIALTSPYMHDGSLQTLNQCLDHYTNPITNTTNLDPLLLPNGIPMTSQEKQDIIAFLMTLTDYKFIADKRFADPNL